jgi:hypothetical protein
MHDTFLSTTHVVVQKNVSCNAMMLLPSTMARERDVATSRWHCTLHAERDAGSELRPVLEDALCLVYLD